MNKLDRFNILLREFYLLKYNGIVGSNGFNNNFLDLLDQLESLKSILRPKKDRTKESQFFKELISDLGTLKNDVIKNRKEETESIIEKNRHKLKISSFELMEHNFRENTHSNILEYIFDFNYTGDIAPKILSDFLFDLNSDQIPELVEKLAEKKYTITREQFTGKGRIDLLIKDSTNKFAIVIENKILANISESQFEDDGGNVVSRTQLDNYKEFILENSLFIGWDTLFIVLSYKSISEFTDSHFIYTDYKNLYNSLLKTETHDPIISDYKILLNSLLNNNLDKKWLINLSQNIYLENTILNLNKFELINIYLN